MDKKRQHSIEYFKKKAKPLEVAKVLDLENAESQEIITSREHRIVSGVSTETILKSIWSRLKVKFHSVWKKKIRFC